MEIILLFLESVLRLTLPVLFAAMGGLISERAGVINLALEGFMLVGAFVAAAVTFLTSNFYLGWIICIIFGCLHGLFYGFAAIGMKVNQVVAGTAFNLLGFGLCPLFGNILFGSTGSTPALDPSLIPNRFGFLVGLGCFLFVCYFFYRTPLGLQLRFCGDQPDSLRANGKSILLTKYFAAIASGALAAMGGATLSLLLSSGFSRNMTSGRGFIAVAAVVLGRWKPIPTCGACLLFASGEALQIKLQGSSIFGELTPPTQLVQALPYALTLLLLVLVRGKTGVPKALGS